MMSLTKALYPHGIDRACNTSLISLRVWTLAWCLVTRASCPTSSGEKQCEGPLGFSSLFITPSFLVVEMIRRLPGSSFPSQFHSP